MCDLIDDGRLEIRVSIELIKRRFQLIFPLLTFDNFRLMKFFVPLTFHSLTLSSINAMFFLMFTEKKRRIYDQYGKEGLLGHNEGNYGNSNNHHRRRHTHDPFEDPFIFGGFPFVFRDPEDVFREFFGGSPFDEIFNPGHSRRHQNGHAGGSRHHRSSHPQNVMSPFVSFSLMDDMFSPHGFGGMNGMNMNSGFTSMSTFNGAHGGGGGGNVKRISTSTSFVNGKKVVTKK